MGENTEWKVDQMVKAFTLKAKIIQMFLIFSLFLWVDHMTWEVQIVNVNNFLLWDST